MRDVWQALVFRAPRDVSDELSAELAALGRGVEIRRIDPREDEVRAFLRSPDQAAPMRAWAERRLAALGADVAAAGLRVEEVEDGRWVEHYQETLRPFPLGRGFTVHPRGRVEREDGRKPLLLVPGRAFGTGEHATTQLCAEQLEDRVRPGSSWLDVGCGTGILLLVALAAGAGRALGIEIDPDAAAVGREVLAQNGAARRGEVLHGGLERVAAGGWDGVVCNISTTFARMHVAALAALPAAGGLLILSGVLEQDLAALAGAFVDGGLREAERRTRGPWGLLTLEKPAKNAV